jgi:hypothetical protein
LKVAADKESREANLIETVKQIKETCDVFMADIQQSHIEAIKSLQGQNDKNDKFN